MNVAVHPSYSVAQSLNEVRESLVPPVTSVSFVPSPPRLLRNRNRNPSPATGKTVRIRVHGEGVSPVLRIDPADGRLDMGRVLEGDTFTRWSARSRDH